MVSGEAKVRGDVSTFLAAGVSIQHLWFKPRDRLNKDAIALESYDTADAYFCEACKVLSIDVKDSKLANT